MALPLMKAKRVLAAKIETTPGTAVSLANTDAAFRTGDRGLKIVGDLMQRENQGAFGVAASVASDLHTELTAKLLIHGKGASGDVPAWASTLLPAMAMPISTATAALASAGTNWKALSVGDYVDGFLTLGRGMMGSGIFNFIAGKPVELELKDWKGGYVADPSDVALLSGMTYETALPPPWAGTGSLALNTVSTYSRVGKIGFDLGNQVELRENPNFAGGYEQGVITNRMPKLLMDPEVVAVATHSFGADFTAATEIAVSIVLGTTLHNILTFTIGAAVLNKYPDFGDRGGKYVNSLEYLVCNDSASIVFS